jgi:deazaflavin-dependent oxidoreductase (nitroreductase family)
MEGPQRSLTKVFNAVARPLAGSGLIAVWGVVEHTGRRSGRAFSTPVALAATSSEFFVPLPFGEGTDWCRNIRAANGGAIRYRGHNYRVADPQLVGADVATRAFPRVLRPVVSLFGIERFLRLRRVDSAMRKSDDSVTK